ncbi:protein translocase subunit SecF [Myxococcota bacterium]|nr:protein translocase subunit SecF [Myxococcota bacterium]
MPFQIIKPDQNWDFLGKRRLCLGVSVGLILLGLLALPFKGMKMGIDFAGGTEIQLRFDPDSLVGEGVIRRAATKAGIENPTVVRFGSEGNEFLLKFHIENLSAFEIDPTITSDEAELDLDSELKNTMVSGSAETRINLVRAIEKVITEEIAEVSVERVEFVGPKVGAELRRSGLLALGVACLFILAYIAFRFSARFAPGAVLALIHDVLITGGLWVLLGFEFDLRVLAALLAIIGYSLNDTIIVYDRVRENMELRTTYDLVDVLNRSVNQTLSRTLLTSLTTLLALTCMLILGGSVIRPFALAMTLGVVVGTFSSVYVAAPVLLFLENRKNSSEKTA